ncbi:MAG: hypothetical protein NTZ82_03645 [Bacteroidetes bacterium]|nr:hypothetical protein [Bacteroidota bacterium]
MALIKFRYCAQSISDKALECVHCYRTTGANNPIYIPIKHLIIDSSCPKCDWEIFEDSENCVGCGAKACKIIQFELAIDCYECGCSIINKNTTNCKSCGAPLILFTSPIKIDIQHFDFPKLMSWDEANKACSLLGNGWRLPDNDELFILYTYRDIIGGFVEDRYWSSSESLIKNGELAEFRSFEALSQKGGTVKLEEYYVRAVRSILKE